MKVTYLGTANLLFDDGVDQILFDAHFTRPSIPYLLVHKLKTNETVVDEVIKRCNITRLKAIFVSHSHHDHVMDMPYLANKTGAQVYGSASTLNVALGGGVAKEQQHLYEPYKKITIGAFQITVLPSKHSKAKWYNNDIGQTIDRPLVQPVWKKEYKEGGSFDFLVEHSGKTYLIRPSFNYIEEQLKDIHADVLFLGIGGMSKQNDAMRRKFFEETIGRVTPHMVVPIHWDNFFSPLQGGIKGMPFFMDRTALAFRILADYCEKYGVQCMIQPPLSYKEYE